MENQNITKFPRYKRYKDSGVDWIGEIPEHWELKKASHYFRAKKGSNAAILTKEYCGSIQGDYPVYSGQTENDGILASINSYEFDYSNSGCILTTTVGAKAMSVSYLQGRFSLSQNCMIIEPKSLAVNMKYYSYLFTTIFSYYRELIPDHMQASFRMEDFYGMRYLLPTSEEQTAIAQFLDHKTAQIDRAIAIKEEQIKLLNERKQIMIQEAVTKGLDPTVPMKDSGVEWIGEIPKHWNVLKLKYLLLEKNIRSTTGEEELLSLSQYRGVIPRSTLEDRAGMAESLIGYKKVFKTNLVINRMQAANGLLAISNYNGITSPDYAVYREIRDSFINLNYVCLLLRLPRYLAEFKKRVTGAMAGFIRLYTDDLYAIKISVPSFEEQNKIVAFIDMHIETTTKAITYIENQIQALKEYKTTLINEAVTGKIKVN